MTDRARGERARAPGHHGSACTKALSPDTRREREAHSAMWRREAPWQQLRGQGHRPMDETVTLPFRPVWRPEVRALGACKAVPVGPLLYSNCAPRGAMSTCRDRKGTGAREGTATMSAPISHTLSACPLSSRTGTDWPHPSPSVLPWGRAQTCPLTRREGGPVTGGPGSRLSSRFTPRGATIPVLSSGLERI